MKELYYKIFCLCLFIFSIGNITAQECELNFTITTVSAPSTCQSNGTITVSLGGDISNISHVQYGLTSTSGFTINPQENNVLTNIPAGTYTVTARAFCLTNSEYSVVKTATNVIVGGTYQVPEASFNISSSRKSYDTCNTGIIVLDVTNGSGTFTFNITSAPDGALIGPVTPIKNGTLYTLPSQNYPAGNYEIQIGDGCYTTVCTFTLGQITGFPAFNYSYSTFVPPALNTSCTTVPYTPGSISSTADPDYYRYFTDGMYEVGIAPTGGSMPTAWTAWSTSKKNFELPSPYSNFFSTGSLSVYVRLKGCDNSYTSKTTELHKPWPTFYASSRTCENYIYGFYPYADYDGFFCYPISMVVTQTSAGEGQGSIVFEKYNILSGDITSSRPQTVALEYGRTYVLTTTDANGIVDVRPAVTPTRGTMSPLYSDNNCSTQYLLTYSSTDPCYPIDVTIKDNSSGTIIHSYTLTSTVRSNTFYLEYGKAYSFDATYVGTDPLRTYNTTINRPSTVPTAYSLALYTTASTDACVEDQGRLQINSSGSLYFPVGTTFTITGPAGYTTQTATVTSTTSYTYTMPTTKLPAGTYTLSVVHGCGNTTPITTILNHNGVYSGKQLNYTTTSTCSEMKVTPSGYITYQGVNQPNYTYYRLTSGPTGYDKTPIKPGGSFSLSKPGIYKLGITYFNSTEGCILKEMTIDYTAPPFELDKTGTIAYQCTDNPVGTIFIKAQNGILPYTYELWNEDNTVKMGVPDIVSADGEQIHFNYGKSGDTYTVRISDACKNNFAQKTDISDLSTLRIVYASNENVCTDGNIELKCITLGNTAYEWTGPNGYTSTTQSPTITNAQANMSGWYKVSVQPEFCGEVVQDSVKILVYPPLTAGAVTGSQDVCVRTTPSTLSSGATGGSGIYTYQWQTSEDGVTGWENISLATSVTYVPPFQINSGAYYYRVLITDACGTIESNVITVNVKPCSIPINPNIRVRIGK